jgi:hypothetical protein
LPWAQKFWSCCQNEELPMLPILMERVFAVFGQASSWLSAVNTTCRGETLTFG